MTPVPRCRYTTWIGSYLIGALVPAERTEVAAHLRTCAPCRAELVSLAVLPGLLARLHPARAHPTAHPG